MPISSLPPVPRTQAGFPSRSSAHRRISSWSVKKRLVVDLPVRERLLEDVLPVLPRDREVRARADAFALAPEEEFLVDRLFELAEREALAGLLAPPLRL